LIATSKNGPARKQNDDKNQKGRIYQDKMIRKYKKIEWKIHCTSPVEKIFRLLDSNEGRKKFGQNQQKK